MKQLLILIDGNSLINRAFYALPPLNTSDGRPSQAVYGFCNMLFRAIADFSPTHAAVAFDVKHPTFRHKQYEQYKATRKGMPDELAVQLPMLKELLTDMNIKILEKEGFEADDILGHLSDIGIQNIIITGDRDSFQLIDDDTKVAFTKKGISQVELYDSKRFTDEFGFAPASIVDYKALCGDQSDNIPGVCGIGDKRASALIAKYKTLDNLYDNINQISGNLHDKLIDGKNDAYLSYKLATIEKNVGLNISLDECKLQFPFSANVRRKFINYNFKSLAARTDLFLSGTVDESLLPKDDKAEKVQIKQESITDLKSLDIQSDFSLLFTADTVFIGQNDTNYEIKIGGDLLGGIFFEDIIKALKPALEDNNICKTVLDAKALKKVLIKHNTKLNNFFDVKISQYLLDVSNRFEDISELCDYYGFDHTDKAAALLKAGNIQKQKLQENGLNDLYYNMEIPLVDVLFDMETVGFKLDMQLNAQFGKEFIKQADSLTDRIIEQCGVRFNLNSPKQLAEVLFEKLKIPYPKKGKSYSTAFEILDPLKDEYPIISLILDYRRITKLNNTYIEGFKKLADPSGVIHTDFKQALTLTGRLSSVEPNLQNIPIREDDGKQLRALFTSREGKTLVCADYSQIELRLLAHFSGDKTMTEAFVKDEDIHAQTAALVYGVSLQDVTPQMRQDAKAVNFGIIYGISDFGLAQSLRITVSNAHVLIDNYFKKFGDIKRYMDENIAEAYRTGYSKTVFGRIRRIPELNSPTYLVKKFGERVAMNTPLQGSAADIIKAAMIKVAKRLDGTSGKLILQVHDELIVEADINEAEKIKEILVFEMENVIKLNIPLKVSAGIGKRWLDCK